jgi:hypothetical protein
VSTVDQPYLLRQNSAQSVVNSRVSIMHQIRYGLIY